MTMVQLRRASQITLPNDIRKMSNLKEGDYFNAFKADNGDIVLRPVIVRSKQEAWEGLQSVLSNMRELNKNKPAFTEEDEEFIMSEIKAHRQTQI